MSRNIASSKKKSVKSASKKVKNKRIRPTGTVLTNWKTEKCFQDQEEIFAGLLDDIRSASVAIDMEMFIFQIDPLGITVLNELKKAAKRGVEVRLIVDGLGSPMFTKDFVKRLTKQGVNVKVYKPVTQLLRRLKISLGKFEWQRILNDVLSMNSRNHRKLCLIDNKIGWVGSANISVNYAEWRETMIRVSGENVSKISEGFEWLWRRVDQSFIQRKVKDIGNHLVYHNLSPLNKKEPQSFRVHFINSATKSIKLINPYFIPPYSLLLPLLNARQRGVDVSILTSKKTDYFFTRWFAQSYYQVLLKQGVKIYEQKTKFMHSKVLIVDDKAMIGTSNYNHRSLNSDMEIDLLVDHIDTINRLVAKWDEDIRESDLILDTSDTTLWKSFIRLLNPLKKIS